MITGSSHDKSPNISHEWRRGLLLSARGFGACDRPPLDRVAQQRPQLQEYIRDDLGLVARSPADAKKAMAQKAI
eukprot:5124066-Pyramimonas_sp.AAC.1